MALMTLLRLPTQEDLNAQDIENFENFYEDFIANTVAPFTAKVHIKNNGVALAGYMLFQSDWFKVAEE